MTQKISVGASGDVRLEEFDQWLLSLGDGIATMISGKDIIELPDDLCSVIDKADEKKSMTECCDEIFPDLTVNVGDEKWLEGRAVLAPTNHKVDNINNMMTDKLSGQLITIHSSDGLDNDRDAARLKGLAPKMFLHLLSIFGTNFETGLAMQSFFNFVHVFHKNIFFPKIFNFCRRAIKYQIGSNLRPICSQNFIALAERTAEIQNIL